MLNRDHKETIEQFHDYHRMEHDSCAIICIIEKQGIPTRTNVDETIRSMIQMEHRSGFINGEGDGCGILTDIPRQLWSHYLNEAGLDGTFAHDPRFAVAHVFVPRSGHDPQAVQDAVRALFVQDDLTILLEKEHAVNSEVLGKNGQRDEPIFWQLAIAAPEGLTETSLASRLFHTHTAIEAAHNVHVASLSSISCVYKLMGCECFDAIFPRFSRRTVRLVHYHRSQSLFHQYLIQLFPRPAFLPARSQWRDQYYQQA